jgi:hypothetical protein
MSSAIGGFHGLHRSRNAGGVADIGLDENPTEGTGTSSSGAFIHIEDHKLCPGLGQRGGGSGPESRCASRYDGDGVFSDDHLRVLLAFAVSGGDVMRSLQKCFEVEKQARPLQRMSKAVQARCNGL